ncbi:hypothetical protein LEP1GSC133_4902 [Leptospira borgpetersenii serovar Pomona str. 200901868]|uniref:Uncharacterized protein n=1 Tax=Leptospira borgpetersenii serovar Pomona str. 200901868 TaxID=1192866 RepID=M6WAK0_LEPBO|nr:hypothetical protein LEP1GSC133_4902 [Leptospira borgpetersenii serovar Pomona str. 200901868]
MIPSVKYKVDSLFRKFLRGSYRKYKLDLDGRKILEEKNIP